MSDPFRNAPTLGKEFQSTQSKESAEVLENASRRNPTNQVRRDEQEHLKLNPPRAVYTPETLMVPSPSGNIEYEVISELGPDEQRAIQDAQLIGQEVDDVFRDLRSVDEEPVAGEHHEVVTAEHDDFKQRMKDRFNHNHENDKGPYRD